MAIKDLKQRFTGTASDYISATSETQLQNQNISYWESLLQPAQQTLEASTKAAETKHGYDITNAYRSYLNQQEQIANSGLLDVSKKQRIGILQSAYEGAYLQSQANLASSYQKAQDEYSKSAASAYSELEATAGKMKELDEYIFENIENNYRQYGFSEEEVNNMYKYNDETKQYEITDVGKALYNAALESVDEQTKQNVFAANLKEENEDLWNFYLQNKDFVTRTLAGETELPDYKTYVTERDLKNEVVAYNKKYTETLNRGNSGKYKTGTFTIHKETLDINPYLTFDTNLSVPIGMKDLGKRFEMSSVGDVFYAHEIDRTKWGSEVVFFKKINDHQYEAYHIPNLNHRSY